MSNGKKIYEITDTATSFAADDYIAVAGETNGTRKILRTAVDVRAHNADAAAHGGGMAHAESATVQPGPHSNAGASGAITLTLGSAAKGDAYRFDVLAAHALTIQAPAGATIRVGSQATESAGSISSDVIGASIQLVAIADNALLAISAMEVW